MDQSEMLLQKLRTRGRLASGDAQHPIGNIDAGDLQSCLGERQRDPPRAASELEHASARLARKALVEGNVANDWRTLDIKRIKGLDEERVRIFIKPVHDQP